MVLEIVTLGVIGATYISCDKDRKDKMKKIGREIVDVTKTTAQETATGIKNIYKQTKAKHAEKKNMSSKR